MQKGGRCYRKNSNVRERTNEGSIDPEVTRAGVPLEKGFQEVN